jgi:hypothetical protein
MLHCGVNRLGESSERRGVVDSRYLVDYRYLAINTGLNISILITYILFLTKLQKRQTPEKDLPY